MTLQDLTFRQIAGETPSVNSLFIHPSGMQAVVVNGIPDTDDDAAEEVCYQWMQEELNPDEPFDPKELLTYFHELFKDNELQASAAIVTRDGPALQVHWAGDFNIAAVTEEKRLLKYVVTQYRDTTSRLGIGSEAGFSEVELRLTGNNGFILYGHDLNHDRLRRSKMSLSEIRQGNARELFAQYANRDNWSALVFPIGVIADLADPNWPYDPFMGEQEPRLHERAGLRKIAAALFRNRDFDGFKIIEGPQVVPPNYIISRLPDALLICPLGVFLMELKDHYGSWDLYLGRDKLNSLVSRSSRHRESQNNPVATVREALKPFSSEFNRMAERVLGRRIHCMGMVVFTNDSVDLDIIDRDDRKRQFPHQDGDVIICRPRNLVDGVRKYRNISQPVPLTPRQMDQLATQWIAVPRDELAIPQPSQDFTIDFDRLLESESSGYYKVYPAVHSGDPVWAKEFTLSSLSALAQQDEFAQIGREVTVVQQLNRRRVRGIQYMYGQQEAADSLYVFVEPAHPRTLEDWIGTNPSRAERLSALRKLADILVSIGNLPDPVVHRAINPRNIRIGDSGEPQLINFELCQRTTIVTLPVNARRTFDERYQAPEVSEHGRQLTAAADVFSFMLCAYFTLTENLPFRNSIRELIGPARRWTSRMEELGLPGDAGKLWRQALHTNARQRPTIAEVKQAMQSWE